MSIAFDLLFIIGAALLLWSLKLSKREAGRGAVLSLAGFVLMIPSLGSYMQDPDQEKKAARKLPGSDKNGAQAEVFTQQSKMDCQLQLLAKQDVLVDLNAKLSAWHQALEARRKKLVPANTADVANFNDDVAAYAALRTVAGERTAEIQKLEAEVQKLENAALPKHLPGAPAVPASLRTPPQPRPMNVH